LARDYISRSHLNIKQSGVTTALKLALVLVLVVLLRHTPMRSTLSKGRGGTGTETTTRRCAKRVLTIKVQNLQVGGLATTQIAFALPAATMLGLHVTL
jgi:hypothetical protein